MINDKQIIIQTIRLRLKRMYFMFLMAATVNPLILLGMLFILYSLGNENLYYVYIFFAITIPIQIILSLIMYRKYKKIYDLDDENLLKTKVYINTEANIYVKSYFHENHLIQIINGLNSTSLLVDGIEVSVYKGPRVRNYKLKAKIKNDIITAVYKQGIKDGLFSLFYNKIKLEEKTDIPLNN